MRYLSVLYASVRALMIATLAHGVGGGAHAQAPLDREAQEWNAARGAGTIEAYQRYLELFPVGRHAGEAFRAIVELSIDPETSIYTIAPGAGDEAPPPSTTTQGLAQDMY